MPDQNIAHLRTSVKELNARLHKLNRIMDRLQILAYQQKRLSKHYKELLLLCAGLSEHMHELDVIVFEADQEVKGLGMEESLIDKINF